MRNLDRLRPVADLAVCLEHCEWVVRHQADGLFAIRVLTDMPQGGRSVTASQFFDNRSSLFGDEIALFLRRNCHQSAHVFYSVSSFTAPVAKTSFASPGRLLHVDADEVSLPPRGPWPSRIVESSPGNHHFIYVLDRPVSRFEAESLSKALQQLVGGDKGGQSVAKLLRLPGTFNAKHDCNRVRILESSGHVYSLEDIRSFLPEPPPELGSARNRRGMIGGERAIGHLNFLTRLRLRQRRVIEPFPIRIKGQIYRYAGDDRSQIVFQTVLGLVRANWPRETIARTIAETVFWRSRRDEGKAEDMDRLIDKVFESAEVSRGMVEK